MVKCGECKFWDSDQEYATSGFCRRYAPRPTARLEIPDVTGYCEFWSYWPITAADECCAEAIARLDSQALESQVGTEAADVILNRKPK